MAANRNTEKSFDLNNNNNEKTREESKATKTDATPKQTESEKGEPHEEWMVNKAEEKVEENEKVGNMCKPADDTVTTVDGEYEDAKRENSSSENAIEENDVCFA